MLSDQHIASNCRSVFSMNAPLKSFRANSKESSKAIRATVPASKFPVSAERLRSIGTDTLSPTRKHTVGHLMIRNTAMAYAF